LFPAMAYSTNPHLPRLRMEAVKLVRQGWTMRAVARYTGFAPGTISKWVKRAPEHGNSYLATRSSRPMSHPHSLDQKTVQAICNLRLKHKRCAEVIHHLLKEQGTTISLSSVKRVLKRKGLLKEKSKWKKYHRSPHRPDVASAGDLVELDTIHIHTFTGKRFYIYTLLDVHSRWAHAKVSLRITASRTVKFLEEAKKKAPFAFKMIQSDHGSEFSQWFTTHAGIAHRHSRVRTPNDNAHLERFNRTIQEECLYYLKQEPKIYQAAIKQYIPFYNNERPHLALHFLSPSKCFQAID
jgi:transposase InsO family protein